MRDAKQRHLNRIVVAMFDWVEGKYAGFSLPFSSITLVLATDMFILLSPHHLLIIVSTSSIFSSNRRLDLCQTVTTPSSVKTTIFQSPTLMTLGVRAVWAFRSTTALELPRTSMGSSSSSPFPDEFQEEFPIGFIGQ